MSGDLKVVRVPADIAERHRLAADKERLRLAKFESNRGRKHSGHTPLAEREFTVWDGEGPQDTGYSLLGNSDGDELCYPRLRTRDCLNLILEAARKRPERIHVAFGFNYDVSCILWELSWRHFRSLKDTTRVLWRDYELQHVPRKWFRVKRGNTTVTIYDVHSFFMSSLTGALEKWEVGPWGTAPGHAAVTQQDVIPGTVPFMSNITKMTERELVETFKRLRGEFLWRDIQAIAVYMRLELKYTKILCERLREQFLAAGYLPRSWHGPGALARMAFKRHDVYKSLAETPADVQVASMYGFIGGRFETVKAGRVNGRVYCADINSAYPYYCSMLPDLAGKWVYTRTYSPDAFAIWRVRFTGAPEPYALYPLPYRSADGGVSWPHRTESWYWSPEIATVANDNRATILEGYVFHPDNPEARPFAWIPEYYRRRKLLKKTGNPAEYTFKLILNAVYGQLAQRAGWDRKTGRPPKSHQLEFAGWITSACRAAVYQAAQSAGPEALLSIDTDGVMATTPFTGLTAGSELGEWELKTYDDGLFWQNGIYALVKIPFGWENAKTRGIPKGSYTVDDLMDCMESGEPLRLTRNSFTGYGLALNGRHKDLNQWTTEPRVFEFGGGGKRYHPLLNGKCSCGTSTQLHNLAVPSMLTGPFTDATSHPHELPWHGPRSDWTAWKTEMEDMMLFDENHLDYDEQWVRNYAGC